jgi:competence protein ComEC
VLLGWNPCSILDPGFQPSLAAVAAIFVVVPALERTLSGMPLPGKLLSIVAVASGCGLATAPILWLQFGSIPVWLVIANALAEPIVAPLLRFGLLTALLADALPDAAAGLGWVNGHLADYLGWCAETIGGAPHARVESGRWSLVATLVSMAPFAWLGLRGRSRRRLGGAIVAAASILLVGGWRLSILSSDPLGPRPEGLRLTMLGVGQGESLLIQTPDVDVIVDQGESRADVAGRLRRLGVEKLDLLVFSHPQRDHLGGAEAVIERFPVDRVLDPALAVESSDYDNALALIEQRDVPVTVARAGTSFTACPLQIDVLWPPNEGLPGAEPHDLSVVLLVSYGASDILLTGDAESPVLQRIDLPEIDVLKVSNHGSDDDGLPALLRRVRPWVALISAGASNRFGHPHPDTLGALGEAGVVVYRTDTQGDLTLEIAGGRVIRASTANES